MESLPLSPHPSWRGEVSRRTSYFRIPFESHGSIFSNIECGHCVYPTPGLDVLPGHCRISGAPADWGHVCPPSEGFVFIVECDIPGVTLSTPPEVTEGSHGSAPVTGVSVRAGTEGRVLRVLPEGDPGEECVSSTSRLWL